MKPANLSRRQFIQGGAAVTGSLVVGFHVPFLKRGECASCGHEYA